MNYILIIAAAGATFLSGTMTNLDAVEVAKFGIEIEARNFDRELTVDPGPLFIKIDLSQFNACKVRGLGIDVRDEVGVEIFGASISEFGTATYPFRIAEEHLAATTVAIACDSGPDTLDPVYLFKLEDVVKAQLQLIE